MSAGAVMHTGMAMVDNVAGAATTVGDDVLDAVVTAGKAADSNPFGLAPLVLDDVDVAATRADEAAVRIRALIDQFGEGSLDDAAQAASKDARIGAHRINMDGQGRLKKYVDGETLVDPSARSTILQGDAHLEDANWQLARKPSPDGRFNGIDLPGALADTLRASAILRELAPKVV